MARPQLRPSSAPSSKPWQAQAYDLWRAGRSKEQIAQALGKTLRDVRFLDDVRR